jgi:ribose/xylose/arabinose/galactoside ABC-type transport system permease subunit
MTVEVLAGPVITHRRPRVCVAGRDLHVPQVHARVETGRERFTDPVEWVTSKNTPLGGPVPVGAVLALPWLHHSVLRYNRTGRDIVAAAATW